MVGEAKVRMTGKAQEEEMDLPGGKRGRTDRSRKMGSKGVKKNFNCGKV